MDIYRNFILDIDNKFVFCYVPKVACTNWKCILRGAKGLPDYLNSGLAHSRKGSGLTFLSDVSDPESYIDDPEFKKICFVRNPFTRVLSAYLNKVKKFSVDNFPPERDPHFFKVYENIELFRVEKELDSKIVDFSVFVRWLTDNEAKYKFGRYDEHWRPQNKILALKRVKFDTIGKFEQITEDSQKILDQMGCSIPFPSQKEVRFPPTKASGLVNEYYTSDIEDLVRSYYVEDFEGLNYSLSLADCKK